MRALLVIAGFLMLAGISAAAQGRPPRGEAQAGERLALRVCSACHIVAARQEMPLVAHNAPSFFAIADRPGTTRQSLAAFLAHPHALARMPFPQLTPRQIADVSAYILSLRGRH